MNFTHSHFSRFTFHISPFQRLPSIALGVKMKIVMGSRGRIVIPSTLRKFFGITARTRIIVESDAAGRIILKPITRKYVHSLRGRLRRAGLLKALAKEKMRERGYTN